MILSWTRKLRVLWPCSLQLCPEAPHSFPCLLARSCYLAEGAINITTQAELGEKGEKANGELDDPYLSLGFPLLWTNLTKLWIFQYLRQGAYNLTHLPSSSWLSLFHNSTNKLKTTIAKRNVWSQPRPKFTSCGHTSSHLRRWDYS